MNRRLTHRSSLLVAAVAASSGIATAAWAATSAEPPPPARPTATVIADLDARAAEVDRAVAAAATRAGVSPASIRVRRTGGPLEAAAQASALASQHPTAVAAAGDDARAALQQAESAELAPGTAWLSDR